LRRTNVIERCFVNVESVDRIVDVLFKGYNPGTNGGTLSSAFLPKELAITH
jgi:hypothetical protein